MGRFEENDVPALELKHSFKFAMIKQVVLNLTSTQFTMCSNSSNVSQQKLLNCKSLLMDSQRLPGTLYPCFPTNLYIQSLHPEKLEIFKLILHNIRKWLRVLIKRVVFAKFLLEGSNFELIEDKFYRYRLRWV